MFRAVLGTESLTEAAIAAESKAIYRAEDAYGQDSEFAGKDGLTYRWIGQREMDKLPFPNVFIRILNQYWT